MINTIHKNTRAVVSNCEKHLRVSSDENIKRMRILTISNCPLVESQGSGYVIINFCRGLLERGHQVDLYGPESYEPFKFWRSKAKSYRQALGMLFFALIQLNKKNYDVVEFYGGESWLAASVLSMIYNRRYLLVSHSNGLETYAEKLLLKYLNSTSGDELPRKWYQLNQAALIKKAFTKVDGIVTVSKEDRNYALKYRYNNDERIVAIENCLPDTFLDLKVNFQRKPVIGYCGSWLPRKGIKLIESDITKLLINFPECLFKIIGVDASFCKEEHFPATVCSQIEVIPFVASKQELQNIYQSISIFILPSIYESFGLVIAEAMACGCAIAATKTGFAANLRDGEEAIAIAEPLSPHLYESVSKLLLNEPLRLQVAKKGYQRVQQLRWESAVEQLEKTYLKWLGELRQ